MSASCTALRLITLLFLLAGILLLRKPVFGQTKSTSRQVQVMTTLGEKPAGQYNRVRDNLLHIELPFEAMKNPAVCVESLQPQSR